MSPFDMMFFFCIILVAVKCTLECVEFWKDFDEEAMRQPRHGAKRDVNVNACIRASMHNSSRAKTTVHPNTPTVRRAA